MRVEVRLRDKAIKKILFHLTMLTFLKLFHSELNKWYFVL